MVRFPILRATRQQLTLAESCRVVWADPVHDTRLGYVLCVACRLWVKKAPALISNCDTQQNRSVGGASSRSPPCTGSSSPSWAASSGTLPVCTTAHAHAPPHTQTGD
jgi:hypothetical protein